MIKCKFSIIFIILILSILPSCGNNSSDSDEFITLWFDDSQEYRTNNQEIAQNETPFSIVLPTYLPRDLVVNPFFEGRSKNAFTNDLPISIMYYRNGKDFNYIYIKEFNKSINSLPTGECNYLTFSDIEVFEQDIEIFTLSSDSKNIPGFLYIWDINDIHFQVEIYEYPRDIARKIIDSMIM